LNKFDALVHHRLMKETDRHSSAGLGDAYWYEWSVGQGYVIEMLATDSEVESVTLQKSGEKGLDDVVVKYTSGNTRLIQVKNTRVDDTLTFADLVAGEAAADSLLRKMALAWDAEASWDDANGRCEAWLVTNRRLGQNRSTTDRHGPRLVRPALDEFLAWFHTAVSSLTALDAIVVPDDWRDAWTVEWMPQLEGLETSERKLQFLQRLQIHAAEPGLEEIHATNVGRLAALFDLRLPSATRLHRAFDEALRDWTTSLRKAETITRPAAYEKLCLVDDELVGNHEIPPPAPFFPTRIPVGAEIANLLLTRAAPVVFVVGEPGSGKTALMSYLANRREPLVGARFHAYEPITPQNRLLPADAGRTTTTRALWSDLLLQLKATLRGRSAEFGVPVHAGSLSEEKLRFHVLRLAEAIGVMQGRPFVIAIDGIDHAARSGSLMESFLGSLVPPEDVPQHVAFVIVGQSPENFPSYPTWLRAETEGVRRYELRNLDFGDTRQLLRASRPDLDELSIDGLTQVVWHRCSGHALSTVFAAEEARTTKLDSADFAFLLDARRLSSRVEGYYHRIWTSVATGNTRPSAAMRIAACLCLSPLRIDEAALCAVLGSADETDARDILRGLRPLVVEESRGFRLFHNDVRVFLLRQLRADPRIYQECASRLAEHLAKGTDAAARHAAAQDLFGVAGRKRDQAALFTPHYVLEGYAVGRTLGELSEQADVAARALVDVEADWELAHSVATGLRTLVQLRATVDVRASGNERVQRSVTAVPRMAEIAVRPTHEWNRPTVLGALGDILDLARVGELARAQGTFTRWFQGMTPLDIAKLLGGDQGSGFSVESDPDTSVFDQLGAASARTRVLLASSATDTDFDVESRYARGLLTHAHHLPPLKFAKALRRLTSGDAVDLHKLLGRLVDARDWIRAALLLRNVEYEECSNWMFRVQAAAVAELIDIDDLRAQWTTPVLAIPGEALQGLASTRGDGVDVDLQPIVAMTWAAFLMGLAEPHRDASTIRETITVAYADRKFLDSEPEYNAVALHAAAVLGSLVRLRFDGERQAVLAATVPFAAIVSALLDRMTEKHRHRRPLAFSLVATRIVEGYSALAPNVATIEVALRDVFLKRLDSIEPPVDVLEVVWRTLLSCSCRVEALAYSDRLVKASARGANGARSKCRRTLRRLAPLLCDAGESDRANHVNDLLAWTEIGFREEKERALRQPLDWFRALSQTSSSAWCNEGVRLLWLSKRASSIGGNPYENEVDSAVLAAAAIAGPAALARFVGHDNALFAAEDRALLDGIVGMTAVTTLSREELIAIWSFGTGQLCWLSDEDRFRLAQLRRHLLASGERAGVGGLKEALMAMAPAEFACEEIDRDSPVDSSTKLDASSDARVIYSALRAACDARSWDRVAELVRLIARERLSGSGDAVESALASLCLEMGRYWDYDRQDRALDALIPLLSGSQTWRLLNHAVTHRHYDELDSQMMTMADNMDTLCRQVARVEGEPALRRGLQRLLDMHDMWISGVGRLRVPVTNMLREEPAVAGWPEILLELLMALLETNGQAHLQAALRGISRLLTSRPTLLPAMCSMLSKADPLVQRRFLMIAEPLALADSAGVMREWLEETVHSPQLDIGLAAWSILRHFTRVRAEDLLQWPPPDEKSPSQIQFAGAPLLENPPSRDGLHLSTGRPAASILKHLRQACGPDVDVDELEALLASSLRGLPVSARTADTRAAHDGDMILNPESEAELLRLFQILRIEERRGRFRRIDPVRLAQALVPFVDPYVLLQTPRPLAAPSAISVDRKLDALLMQGSQAENVLAQCIGFELPPAARLMCGRLSTYSSNTDVEVTLNHRLAPAASRYLIGRGTSPRLLNARSTLLYEEPQALCITRPTAGEQWVAYETWGLMPFVGATLDLFPAPLWRTTFQWTPDLRTPLVWTRQGRQVAWFERRSGQHRQTSRDSIYRQPVISRWLCAEDEWDRVQSLVGGFISKVTMEVRNLKE
jgi:hypothetical protein